MCHIIFGGGGEYGVSQFTRYKTLLRARIIYCFYGHHCILLQIAIKDLPIINAAVGLYDADLLLDASLEW
jgi:hypothetical protein